VFAQILDEFGISEKVSKPVAEHKGKIGINITSGVLGHNSHNTSPNDVMVMSSMDMLLNFSGQANHCHCFLHIVNLLQDTASNCLMYQKRMQDLCLMMQKESISNLLQELNWRW